MTNIAGSASSAWWARAADTGVYLFAEVIHGDAGVTLSVRGELDLASSPALRVRLRELLCLPIESLTLDLSGVEFMDSSGLHVLDQVRQEAADRKVPFVMASVPESVQRVLAVTNMAGQFDIR